MAAAWGRTLAVIVLVLSIAPAARAGDQPALGFEMTPYAGYGIGGGFESAETEADLDIDDAKTFGLIVNWRADSNTQYEIIYSTLSTEIQTSAVFVNDPLLEIDEHYLQLGGTILFDGEIVQPYVAMTAGATHFDPVAAALESETFVSFSAGAGVRIWPDRRFGIRLEARYFGTFFDKGSDIFCGSDGADNACAVRVNGRLVNQWQGFAGLTFRL
jgi:opacity protein-like surface antigen